MSTIFKEKIISKFSEFELSLNGNRESEIHKTRRSALDTFEKLGIPTAKNEEFKYTNLNFLEKHDFSISLGSGQTALKIADIEPFLLKDIKENRLVFVNGYFSQELSMLDDKAGKIEIGSLSEALLSDNEIISGHLTKYAEYEQSAFSAINTAFAQDGAYIFIPDGITIKNPIHLLFITDTRSGAVMTNPRNLIVLGRCSQVKIFESSHTIGSQPGLTNSVSEVILGFSSQLEYYKMQNDSSGSYYIGTTQVVQERNSVLNSMTITLRGNFVRNNLYTLLNDEDCEANFAGFYYIDGTSFVDNHTLADHAKPNCFSRELYKGILDNSSTAVFNGKVIVRPNAQKTSAYQANKNILLSNEARINSKPQLEIFADDVKCSHGATSGYLDKDSMFYLRARGIGENAAKSLLLNAFAGEVIEKIKISELRDEVKKQVAERLNVDDIYFCEVLDNIKD